MYTVYMCVFGQQVIASSGNIQSLGTPTAMMPSITQPIGIGLPPPIPAPGLCAAHFIHQRKHNLFLANTTDVGNNVPLIWYKDKPGDQTSEMKCFCYCCIFCA